VKNQEDIVLKSCHSFFDASTSLHDSNIDLARQCLSLLRKESSELANAELNFFKAVDTFKTYNVKKMILPAKLRSMKPLEIVRIVLNDNPVNYKHTDKLILMARQFGMNKQDQQM